MGSRVGVRIGEDGPSQVGLEDLAMMAAQPGVDVLNPSDAMCTYRLVKAMATQRNAVHANRASQNPDTLRGRGILHDGGSKVLRQSAKDQLTIVAAGVTVFEALNAYDHLHTAGITVRVIDLYSVTPIDRATLLEAANATNSRFLTVEDHYLHGGIGDAVLSGMAGKGIRLTKMGIGQIPHSGKPDQLLDHYGISARAIVEKVKQLV